MNRKKNSYHISAWFLGCASSSCCASHSCAAACASIQLQLCSFILSISMLPHKLTLYVVRLLCWINTRAFLQLLRGEIGAARGSIVTMSRLPLSVVWWRWLRCWWSIVRACIMWGGCCWSSVLLPRSCTMRPMVVGASIIRPTQAKKQKFDEPFGH